MFIGEKIHDIALTPRDNKPHFCACVIKYLQWLHLSKDVLHRQVSIGDS